MSGEPLSIEVVFALPERQKLVTVTVEDDATVEDAIARSSLADAFPDWNLADCAVGIWGRLVERNQKLRSGDRVEIYRPLEIDPREARRTLAAQGRSMGQSTRQEVSAQASPKRCRQ
ncbi:MAG TPA: RnfH family protein [Woeseiaceae bacterium]|nr:RnfH family protein [Woeseiaceae bacterium]